MNTRRVYSQTQVKEIAERLSAMKAQPKPEKAVTASGAIALMIEEIKALQGRGYTIAEIADLLRQNDLPVSAATLKSAIARAQPARQSRPRTRDAGPARRSSQKSRDYVAGLAITQPQASGSFRPISDTDEI
jgi:hypothetical protein